MASQARRGGLRCAGVPDDLTATFADGVTARTRARAVSAIISAPRALSTPALVPKVGAQIAQSGRGQSGRRRRNVRGRIASEGPARRLAGPSAGPPGTAVSPHAKKSRVHVRCR